MLPAFFVVEDEMITMYECVVSRTTTGNEDVVLILGRKP